MIRVEREGGRHVVLAQGFLDDPRLSFRAKGLLAYLVSRHSEDVDAEDAAIARERRGDLEAALRELERAGYFLPSPQNGSTLVGTVSETSRLPLLDAQPHPRRSAAPDGRAGEPGGDGEAVLRVLAQLNALRRASWTWVRYTPLSAKHKKNTEHIRGRLKEGYAEQDLILVLEFLAATDGGKDESRRFFDSVTPFNTKNFERNLALARDWDARGRPTTGPLLSLQRADGHDPAIYEKRVRGGEA